jgi:hypothetical protein
VNLKLFVGAKITVLCLPVDRRYADLSYCVPMRGTVIKVTEHDDSDARITWRMETGEYGPWLPPHREGVEWIRGWHNEKSDEVLALLAAAALVRDE